MIIFGLKKSCWISDMRNKIGILFFGLILLLRIGFAPTNAFFRITTSQTNVLTAGYWVMPEATLQLNNAETELTIRINNIENFREIYYLVNYESDQGKQGMEGHSDLSGQSEFVKDGLSLGTCTSGGTCVYNTHVKQLKIDVTLTRQDNSVYKLSANL